MKALNEYPAIKVDEERREITSYREAEYPFAYYYENVWEFDFHSIDWHWHPEVEFLFIEKGRLTVFVGTDCFQLKQGEGAFINSRVLHRLEAEEPMELPNIVFSTEILAEKSSLLYQKYVKPVLKQAAEYQTFRQTSAWQDEILKKLKFIFRLQERKEDCEWETVQHLMSLWQSLYENMSWKEEQQSESDSTGKQVQLQMMLQYLQNNSQKNITLEDLAKFGMVSKSSVQKLFARYLHISPIEYLIRYRLQQAARMLQTTEKTVTEISEAVGFRETAYFCRKFKKLYEVTPTQYRRNNAEHRSKVKT